MNPNFPLSSGDDGDDERKPPKDHKKLKEALKKRKQEKKKKETSTKKRKKKVIGTKEPLRSSNKPKPSRKGETSHPVQKEQTSTLQPEVPVNLGIITWNVAHFGTGTINLATGWTDAAKAITALTEKLDKGYLEWLDLFDPWLETVAKAATFELKTQSQNSLNGMVYRSTALSRAAFNDLKSYCVVLDKFWRAEKLGDNNIDGSWEYLYGNAVAMTGSLRLMRAALRRLREPMNRIQRLKRFFGDRDKELPKLKEIAWVYSYYINEAWTAVVTLDKAVHRILVMKNIVSMFERNTWLDLVALHEVNQGIDILAKYMDLAGLICIPGPHLKSVSGNKAQDEYYPIIFRKSLAMVIHHRFAFFNDGTRHWGLADGQEVTWSKTEKVFRPVVGYEIQLKRWGWQRAMVGIVHTTPYGKEFSRKDVFAQVELPLSAFSFSSIPVTVGGDYYLTAEAAVYAMKDLDLDKSDKIYVREYWKWYSQQLSELRKKREKEEVLIEPEIKPSEEDNEDEDDEENEREADDSEPVRDIEVVNKFDVFRNGLGLSFQSRMEEMGLSVAQPITGTNWKTKEVVRWRAAQIADFYVLKHFVTKAVGIVDPSGGVAWADAEDLQLSQYWRTASDHWPVAAYLSTADESGEVQKIFHLIREF